MRLPDSSIKEAILHPVEMVRDKAVVNFTNIYSADPTIMPLVIEAVERYGREQAFSILRKADRLTQTEATVEWLMNELPRDHEVIEAGEDNYHYTIACILAEANPLLLAPRESEILATPAFPGWLRKVLRRRIELSTWSWDRTFKALRSFELGTMHRKMRTQGDVRHSYRFIEALARHPHRAGKVFDLLRRPYTGKDRPLVLWLEPQLMALAGMMHIEAVIPYLMKRIKKNTEDELGGSAALTLYRIGTDAVVRAIDEVWRRASDEDRWLFATILEEIQTDESVQRCRTFLAAEEDEEVQLYLGLALLGNFDTDAIELLWPIVDDIDEDEITPDERDFRCRLVILALVLGKMFPRFEEWYEAALQDRPRQLQLIRHWTTHPDDLI